MNLKGKAVERYFELNNTLKEFSDLFNNSNTSERSLAIMGDTFLEMVLDHIILSFLSEEEGEVKQLLNGPLKNFSSKIKMVYCLGLMEKKVKHDLDLVKNIRNRFAHRIDISFQDEEINSWCEKLCWYKSSVGKPPGEIENKMIFNVAVNQLITHLNGCVSIARSEKRKLRDNFLV